MEKTLEKQLEETFRLPGVAGVLCADEQGLCLGSKGIAQREVSGYIASIAKQAEQLNLKSESAPVIAIESDSGSLLIKKENGITIAVYKHPE